MTTKQRVIPETSVDTNLIYQRIERAEIGEVITYDEMSDLIGRNVRTKAAHNLASARRRAFNQRQMVFDAVHKVGIKRLNDVEIVTTTQQAIDKARRSARRAAKRITAVRDFDALPKELRVKHNTFMSALSAMAAITKAGPMAKLEKIVGEAQQTLPLAKTLEAFRDA